MDVRILNTQTAREVVTFGRRRHERYRVVGWGDMIEKPIYHDEWWFLPVDNEVESTIPARALARAEAIKSRWGIQGMIVAHEAPMVLPAPAKDPHAKPKTAIKTVAIGATVLGLAGVAVSVVLAVAIGLMGLVGALALVATPVLIDPALIVVLNDGSWIEVMTWLE